MLEKLLQLSEVYLQAVCEIYILLACLRVLFRWTQVSSKNPIANSINHLTQPLFSFVYFFIPIVAGIDLAAPILLMALSVGEFSVLCWLKTGYLPSLLGISLLAFGSILEQFIAIFFYTMMISVIISWIHPMRGRAIVDIVNKISRSLLQLTYRSLPVVIAGLDFGPTVIVIGLKLLSMFIVAPLIDISKQIIALA